MKEKINDLAINVTDGEHGSVKNDIHGEYYLLSNKNINNSKILISNNDRKISEKSFNKINRLKIVENGYVVISTVGTIGKTAVINTSN